MKEGQALEYEVHQGGCHCGAVRYEVKVKENPIVHDCNCSICSKSGYLHLIVSAVNFKLLSGADHIVSYTFGAGPARHLFCKTCGIKSYYIPRSNPDGFSINARCLDNMSFDNMDIQKFDGKNWEASMHKLRSLTEP